MSNCGRWMRPESTFKCCPITLAAQKLLPDIAVELTRRFNNRLTEACARHPSRFAAFAALPTPVPDKAAQELERRVTELGFKGAMIHGLTNGVSIDDNRFGRSSRWQRSSMCQFIFIRPCRTGRLPSTTMMTTPLQLRRRPTTACGSECAETARKRLPRSDPTKRAHKVHLRSCRSDLS